MKSSEEDLAYQKFMQEQEKNLFCDTQEYTEAEEIKVKKIHTKKHRNSMSHLIPKKKKRK